MINKKIMVIFNTDFVIFINNNMLLWVRYLYQLPLQFFVHYLDQT